MSSSEQPFDLFFQHLPERDKAYLGYMMKKLGDHGLYDQVANMLGEKSQLILSEKDERLQRRMIGCMHSAMSHSKCRCVCDVAGACPIGAGRRCKNCTTSGTFYCFTHYCSIYGDIPPEVKARREKEMAQLELAKKIEIDEKKE